jgi:diguanylate cyclase (GGDEF)-like protein
VDYNSKYDFYLKFKPVYNKDGYFIDYIMTYASDSFTNVVGISPKMVLGKRFSDIVVDMDVFGFKEFYSSLIPNSRIKHELYMESQDRWYLVNTFTDSSGFENEMIIYYVDITDLKLKQQSYARNNIFYLKDKNELLYRDKLTGLYNKNFFEEEMIRLDTKRQLPISLIMGDINGLKLINDAFGHTMGDSVLKKSAEIMSASFRNEDIISRVGGDEFVILLPMTKEKTALEIVNRVKRKCENNPLDFIKINISFGVATKTSIDENINKVLKKAEDRMYFNKLRESKEAKLAMIDFLKKRLEKITYETKAHYDRLKRLTMMMAEAMNLSEIEKEELMLLCEFHDIGKIAVPRDILQKQGRLSREEWEDVKRHSEIGYYIARGIKDASVIDELILTHHERWDGKGYPGLLKNDEIPLAARIFAIADAYDMMVNDRPFQTRMTKNAALSEIQAQSGKQFDPEIAEIFIDLMKEEQVV